MEVSITYYLIFFGLFYTSLRSFEALDFNNNSFFSIISMLLIFLSMNIFLPLKRNNDFYAIKEKNEKQLLQKYSSKFLIVLNLLTIVGMILSFIFFSMHINSLNIIDIAIFANAYRAGNYAGSGIYFGIIIYVLPLLISYLLLEGVNYKELFFPTLVLVLVCLLIGLRYFLLLPFLAYIIREIKIFLEGNSENLENKFRKLVNKYRLFFLSTFASFVVIVPKLILRTRMSEDYGFFDFLNSLFGRFYYQTLQSNYNDATLNGLNCLIPIINKFAICDIENFKYIVHIPIVGFTYEGTSTGFEIPLIPLLFLNNFNFLVIISFSIFGSLLIYFVLFLRRKINKFLYKSKPLFSFLISYLHFITCLLPLLVINAVYFDYYNSLVVSERLLIIAILPGVLSFLSTHNKKLV